MLVIVGRWAVIRAENALLHESEGTRGINTKPLMKTICNISGLKMYGDGKIDNIPSQTHIKAPGVAFPYIQVYQAYLSRPNEAKAVYCIERPRLRRHLLRRTMLNGKYSMFVQREQYEETSFDCESVHSTGRVIWRWFYACRPPR